MCHGPLINRALGALPTWWHVGSCNCLAGRGCCHHFIDEEAEAPRPEVACAGMKTMGTHQKFRWQWPKGWASQAWLKSKSITKRVHLGRQVWWASFGLLQPPTSLLRDQPLSQSRVPQTLLVSPSLCSLHHSWLDQGWMLTQVEPISFSLVTLVLRFRNTGLSFGCLFEMSHKTESGGHI